MDWQVMFPVLSALLGGLVGLFGAAIGFSLSVRATKGPRERALVVRGGLLSVVLVALLLSGLIAIPPPCHHLLWIPYLIILIWLIRRQSRMQGRIRSEESIQAGDGGLP